MSREASPTVPVRGDRRWFGTRSQIWLGLLTALVTLYLATRTVQTNEVIRVLREVRLPFVGLTLVTSLLTILFKALRWRALFYPQRPALKKGQLCELIVIGQAVNFYVPARLGELIRAYLTGREAGVGKTYALGTIVAEKFVDIIVLAVLVIAMLPFLVLPDWLSGRIMPIVLTAFVVIVAVATLLGGRRAIMAVAGMVLRRLPPAWAERGRIRLEAGLDGLGGLGQPAAALAIWGWTLVFWLIAGTTNYLLLLAFDLPASPLIALFLLAILQAGIAVPSTPGKIGVFHTLCVWGLAVFGIGSSVGLAYGLVLHALVVGGVSVWAALAFGRRSWNMRVLAQASQTGADEN